MKIGGIVVVVVVVVVVTTTTTTTAVAVLLLVTGSNWPLAVIVAVFDIVLAGTPAATLASIVSVCGAPVEMVPTVHSPFAAL